MKLTLIELNPQYSMAIHQISTHSHLEFLFIIWSCDHTADRWHSTWAKAKIVLQVYTSPSLSHRFSTPVWTILDRVKKTHILKHNIPNLISLTMRHPDFETLYHCFKHTSNEVMCYILNNIEDTKNIFFLI